MYTDSSESEAFGEDPYQPKDNELQEYVEGIAKLNGSMLSNIHFSEVKKTWNIEESDLARYSRWIDIAMKSMGEDITISIEGKAISNSANEKTLGVYFDNNRNFKTHVTKLCKKQVKNFML